MNQTYRFEEDITVDVFITKGQRGDWYQPGEDDTIEILDIRQLPENKVPVDIYAAIPALEKITGLPIEDRIIEVVDQLRR